MVIRQHKHVIFRILLSIVNACICKQNIWGKYDCPAKVYKWSAGCNWRRKKLYLFDGVMSVEFGIVFEWTTISSSINSECNIFYSKGFPPIHVQKEERPTQFYNGKTKNEPNKYISSTWSVHKNSWSNHLNFPSCLFTASRQFSVE